MTTLDPGAQVGSTLRVLSRSLVGEEALPTAPRAGTRGKSGQGTLLDPGPCTSSLS